MVNPKDFARKMLSMNPNVAKTPQGRELLRILDDGDDEAGIKMANAYLNAQGISQEDAMNKAQSFFKF